MSENLEVENMTEPVEECNTDYIFELKTVTSSASYYNSKLSIPDYIIPVVN